MLLSPNSILFNTLNSLLIYLKEDWINQSDKEKSFLYQILKEIPETGDYNFYEQAETVIVGKGKKDTPRELQIRKAFDPSRLQTPTIHIKLNSDNQAGNGIGHDQGYKEPEFEEERGEYRNTFTKRFKSSYSLLITSQNEAEVDLIYTFIRGFMLSAIDYYHILGLENMMFSGQDLNQSLDTADRYFIRTLTVSFEYEITTPSIFREKIINNIFFEQTMLEQ